MVKAFRCSFWVRFSKMYFTRRAGKRIPKLVKSQNVRILLIFQWFHPFQNANSMQKTPPMHLSTSPTSFEGSGTGKHEKKKHKILNNLKLAPKKKLGRGFRHLLPKPMTCKWEHHIAWNASGTERHVVINVCSNQCNNPSFCDSKWSSCWKVVNGV